MIILWVEVVDLFSPPSCDRPQPIPWFSLFHELSILERSIAVRRACFPYFLNHNIQKLQPNTNPPSHVVSLQRVHTATSLKTCFCLNHNMHALF